MSIALITQFNNNPSTDFFIIPELSRRGYDFYIVNGLSVPDRDFSDVSSIVISRYLSTSWRRFIEENRASFDNVFYFMDDDILDIRSSIAMPIRYRYKIWRYAYRHKKWLNSINAKLWVSTPYLLDKYRSWSPSLVSPQPVLGPSDVVTIFYHGSASHISEMKWLFPIIRSVLKKRPNTRFELIGNPEVNALYRSLDRVHVLSPMSWESYKFLLASGSYDIGLAPLLDNKFNASRSHTKFFDITLSGAVGVYSAHHAFDKTIQHCENGMLLPMDPLLWETVILSLIDDKSERARLSENAQFNCGLSRI
jgi:hypothetical protein